MIPGSKGLNPHEPAHRWGERTFAPRHHIIKIKMGCGFND